MKILKKRIKDMSMRNKIFLGMLIAVWIPLVGFGIYTYRNTKNILLEQNYTRMEEQLLQAEKNIQILLESYKNISSIVMMDEILPAMWSADFRQSGYEDMYFYIKDFFAGLQIANGEIKQMAVFSANPTIIQDYTYIYKITPQIQQENWYQKCISSKGRIKIVSGGLAEELNKNKKQEYVFYLVRPLELYNKGEEQTVLRLSMYEQRLYDTISENDESGQMYIVDEDNRIMSCKDKELIGLPVGNVIKKYQGTIGNNHRDKAEVDGREVLLSSVTADEGWKVVSVAYTEEIREKVAKSLINIILFIGIGIFSSVIVSGILASFFTKRLHGLTEAVTEMKNGEFGIQVTKGGKDEIGILERAFSEMSNRVKYLVDEVYQRELMKKTAEFNLLQEQVKPHFLYNVLSSITAMAMRSGNTETIEMVQHLSEFYRISLNKGKKYNHCTG